MAAHNSELRPSGARIRHVIIHTNQGPNPAHVFPDLTAENLARYLDRKDIAPVSYQILTDDDSEVVYIPDHMMSYSARAANPISLNLCFLGYAEWSRDEWLRHPQMMRRGAGRVRLWCEKFNIPMVKLIPADVVAQHYGIIGHADWTYAEKMKNPAAKDSHTDPGTNFPWDVFLVMVAGNRRSMEEEMKIDNWDLRGRGKRVLLYPVGSMSADNTEMWVSASTLGMTGKGYIRVFAQGDKGGRHDWIWDERLLTQKPDNLVSRPGVYLMDAVTKLVVEWDLTTAEHGGVLCVEYRNRPDPPA